MSNLLQLHQGSKAYGSRELFRESSFAINEGEHVGVIGPNGAGKTTLFRILTGSESLDSGELVRARGLRLGHLAQHEEWRDGETVEDFLSRGTRAPIWDLKSLGRGLGLEEGIWTRPIQSLSGGYRMRCKLLHLLGEEPDLLLLDEPTNYLDLESLLVLENFLQAHRGAFLLISHDREFLRRTTDHILEVESGEITKFNGSLDDYFEQKQLLRQQLEARAMSIEEKRRAVLEFVARFGAKATKARQAQSRLKSLERLESIEVRELPGAAVIRLPEPLRTGRQVLRMQDVELGYGERRVLRGVSFNMERGDHLAVVGVNGAGKSTFLKALAGTLEPLAGSIEFGHEVSIGYYAQHVSEALNPGETVLEAMGALAHPTVTHQQVLDLAGALLFSGDDVRKFVSVLSGGEKSRVALGRILLQKAPCLLLDEPTNHLDFQTVEALTLALAKYEGSVVVVSHDRGFIRRVGTKILEIRDGRVEIYPGSYDEYVWSCQKGAWSSRAVDDARPSAADSAAVSADGTGPRKFNFKEEKKVLERELRKAEREMAELDAGIHSKQQGLRTLNERLAEDPENPEGAQWVRDLGRLQLELDHSEARWLELAECMERIQGEISARLQG